MGEAVEENGIMEKKDRLAKGFLNLGCASDNHISVSSDSISDQVALKAMC